ncbi:glycoside hydrolase family 43 protein [Pedobacter heparinus]|uniref:Glycoside hydrolase family 43 n=1 Tax=Pedobacter heparinus (strain ATCC 13125 / DSM 2366 / CIP 104194 / JCM 7457 / NBRC 12017 / NCIMB 9290 / NRRL B-14731 / HIM 762-3) TaxID=485917 RepID=C6Y0H0_PEDHD|nr:glycoside hydrolase family 43 protein [Pedobacter heparinus]ACU02731.1 glycoside hydrolase family 43 [Pedobacter heparinus DSM 2366]
MIRYKLLQLMLLLGFPLLVWSCGRDKRTEEDKSNKGIINPVLDINFPDPTVIKVGDNYYAYATNTYYKNKNYNIPVAVSTDLKTWRVAGDALPKKPDWATKDFWAPHVLFDSKLNKYVMFYSGELGPNTGKCIGVAFSNTPEGPFTDSGTPIISGTGFINIDPFAFIDPKTGKKLLYWGSDSKPIKVQELTDDWKAFLPGSVAKDVIPTGKEAKYDRLVEGAWVDYQDGKYYMYYSGDNCCGAGASYAVLVARADDAFGPFQRYGEANGTGSSVILEKDTKWMATGHNSIFRDGSGTAYIAYHALPVNQTTGKAVGTDRQMLINKIEYVNGWPKVIK